MLVGTDKSERRVPAPTLPSAEVLLSGSQAAACFWPRPGFLGGRRKLTLAGRAIAPKASFLAPPPAHTVGHKPSFAMRSKIPSRSAHEWQVSGDESELHVGSTQPSTVVGEWQLLGIPTRSQVDNPNKVTHRYSLPKVTGALRPTSRTSLTSP